MENMTRSDRQGVQAERGTSLIKRIDRALKDLPDIRSGAGPYLSRLAEVGVSADQLAVGLLQQLIVDVAAELYGRQADPPVELLEFSDGAFDVLFDVGHERTVLMHGLSRQAPPRSRDVSYRRGFPGKAGFDKGDAMSHGQGGHEGGPNYFPQAARLNRGLSPLGSLWRDIEAYLAGHPGLLCFVRLIYPVGPSTDLPAEAEYGVFAEKEIRVVIFPNT